MKKTFHLCLSSGDEIMFRDEEDYNRGFNSFALALYKTDSTGLVESFMSTHTHLLVQTSDPNRFMGAFRMPYTKYFNRKYCRNGKPHRCNELHSEERTASWCSTYCIRLSPLFNQRHFSEGDGQTSRAGPDSPELIL